MKRTGLYPSAGLLWLALTAAAAAEAVSRPPETRQVVVVHHRYKTYPRWGYRTTVLPRSATILFHERVGYRYVNGVFYRPVGRTFVVGPPPVGLVVPVLPPGFVSIPLTGAPFYYHYGTFYVKAPDRGGYQVVPPPVGARVDALPQGYEKVSLRGETFYVLDGVYYQTRINEQGEIEYEVVGNKTPAL